MQKMYTYSKYPLNLWDAASSNSPPTAEMLDAAQMIDHPKPEHQQRLLAIASDDDGPSAA